MKKLIVKQMNEGQEIFIAKVSEEINSNLAKSLRAGDRMLVDSDGLAFIYILEDDSDLYYLYFQQDSWESLHKITLEQKKLVLDLGNDIQIELTSIVEELAFLTENIDGNGNYGEAMETAVQEVFHN
ncbi:UPF0738 family protein [Halalkalibacter alkalisediminis]|uniref:Uncharacterized protein n=1 Tax=Halalkalibacter alkalisediminis TaxID=935616 RepID=A0ABV6NA53_9BACI|nr:hypothetical protein [Halalkalibacter alkalisediminis]